MEFSLPFLLSLLLLSYITASPASPPAQIHRGFTATPDPSSFSSPFQPLLADPTAVFAFGFLRSTDQSRLDLAILHLPSSFPIWRAAQPRGAALWASSTTLSFNGTLSLSDAKIGVLWSAGNAGSSDIVVLLNSSSLQLLAGREPKSILWQSFDFPSDTIVENQNFTTAAALVSANQLYSMKLGPNYIGLDIGASPASPTPMYWKHTALEAKAQILVDGGDIYARVDPSGFLGLYQTELAPVDVLAFDTFNHGISGLRRLTLEPDGNLRAYYWSSTAWVPDFAAIGEVCGLPGTCGPYGLCHADGSCTCLGDNRTGGRCSSGGSSGDACAVEGYWVVRRTGVDLANKELLPSLKSGSLGECEGSCERNCSCWGTVYNNATGFCYRMEYPAELVVAEGGKGKAGYFKVRMAAAREEERSGLRSMRVEAALLAMGAVAFTGVVFGAYRVWRRRKGVEGTMGEGLAVGAYKDLSCSSFQSIELSKSFRR